MEHEISIISKIEARHIHSSAIVRAIIENLQNLDDDKALEVITQSTQEAKQLQSQLTYYRNKRKRLMRTGEVLPLSDCKIKRKQNLVLIYRENRNGNQD